jgi:hypothetical protein
VFDWALFALVGIANVESWDVGHDEAGRAISDSAPSAIATSAASPFTHCSIANLAPNGWARQTESRAWSHSERAGNVDFLRFVLKPDCSCGPAGPSSSAMGLGHVKTVRPRETGDAKLNLACYRNCELPGPR